jgi:hypothetical protein
MTGRLWQSGKRGIGGNKKMRIELKMRILVTGAAGFIGFLCKRLLAMGRNRGVTTSMLFTTFSSRKTALLF